MKSQEIRSKFISFFESRKHSLINSSSLVPHNDDTLLFTNAGMNQFKDIFTGKSNPEHNRAVSIQKCVRAGGKHNDLENVGYTARHHTFFEMLGNFSFGDYFKNEAIEMAWEFLTKELKFPVEKLHVTVHYSDEEALKIWRDQIGVPEDKISKKGDKDNFWEMGAFGPCGPCSEIFYDHGPEHSTPNYKPTGDQNYLDDEERYIEIWNLVFMQYEKNQEGTRDLPKPCIDTGAGLERIAAALQGVYWNYDTDLFIPIIDKIKKLSNAVDTNKFTNEHRIISDHIRSAVMLITDGVLPSNEGRGYVLRRIIRRAVRYLRSMEVSFPFMHKLVPSVFEVLGNTYPQNFANHELASKLIQQEEEKFLETLDHGLKFFEQALKSDLSNKTLKGSAIFKLYDTYGFPVDLTQLLLDERELQADISGFEEAMLQRKEQSKAHWKAGANVDNQIFYKSKERNGATSFLGYENLECEAKLLEIIPIEEELYALVFDQTPFYAESGGQEGDQGVITKDNIEIATIFDTLKPVEDFHLHYTKNASGLNINTCYTLKVNAKSRELTKRNHSATHLLQSALIEILGGHIKQAGSSVSSEKLRFDFTHDKALSEEQLNKVTTLVNKQIEKSLRVNAKVMNFDEALQSGAMALFGEKYGKEVRVLQMGSFSTELCGGTHVDNTAEISHFLITSESSLSSGVRRIEGLTSDGAIQYLQKRSLFFKKVEQSLNLRGEATVQKVESLISESKNLRKEIKKLNDQLSTGSVSEKFKDNLTLSNSKRLFFEEVKEDKDLRKYSDDFINKYPEDLLLLASTRGGKTALLLRTSKKNKNFDCKSIIGELLNAHNGKGGGKPDMAQGSCEKTSMDKLKSDIEKVISNV